MEIQRYNTHTPQLLGTQSKTTLLLRHAISLLSTKIQVEDSVYLFCPFQLKSYFRNLLITYILS